MGFQPLKSPATRTELAKGAQTRAYAARDQLKAVRRENRGEGHGHQGTEGSLHPSTINRGRLWAGDSSNFSGKSSTSVE